MLTDSYIFWRGGRDHEWGTQIFQVWGTLVYRYYQHLNKKLSVDHLRHYWPRQLAASLSPPRPVFAPGSVNVGFVVDEVELGLFPPSSSGFLCRYHSTVAFHAHVLPGE
jgi:hypothetical protein